jgi:hypothetical protein
MRGHGPGFARIGAPRWTNASSWTRRCPAPLLIEQDPRRVTEHDGEHRPQDPFGSDTGEARAKQDARDRARQQSGEQPEIDMAEPEIAKAADKFWDREKLGLGPDFPEAESLVADVQHA